MKESSDGETLIAVVGIYDSRFVEQQSMTSKVGFYPVNVQQKCGL